MASSKSILWLLASLCLLAAAVLIHSALQYRAHLKTAEAVSVKSEERKTQRVHTAISRRLKHLPELAASLEVELAKVSFPPPLPPDAQDTEAQARYLDTQIKQVLDAARRGLTKEQSHVFQFGVGLASGVHPKHPLYLVYYKHEADGHFSFHEDLPDAKKPKENYELDKPEFQWFAQPAKRFTKGQRAGDWVPPYLDPFTHAALTEFAVPLVVNGKLLGSIFANYSAREMRDLVRKEDLGGTGYAAVVSCKTGRIVVHPVNEYVLQERTLKTVEPKLWAKVDRHCKASQGTEVARAPGNYKDPTTARPAEVVVSRLIADGELALIVVYDKHSQIDLSIERALCVRIIVSAVLMLCALILIALRPWGRPTERPTRAWAAVSLISLTLLLGIGGLWMLTTLHLSIPVGEQLPIVSEGRLSPALAEACKTTDTSTASSSQGASLASAPAPAASVGAAPTSNPEASQHCPLKIPTGLFIQSLKIADANSVEVTGYLWQKYDNANLPPEPQAPSDTVEGTADRITALLESADLSKIVPNLRKQTHLLQTRATQNPPKQTQTAPNPQLASPTSTSQPASPNPAASSQSAPQVDAERWCKIEELKRGFILPEAVTADVEELYRASQDNVETIGWKFSATLRQSFKYSTYPLDQKNVWIRLWPENFSDNVILVPDFDAYSDLRPSALPGLESKLVHTGWTLEHSFFSYICGSYNTNFGLSNYVGQANYPELHFHTVLRRTFFSAFVKNLVPLLVAAVILFSVLLLITSQPNLVSRFDFNTSGTMAACSGLFFTVLLAHVQLRDDFSVDGILYLEWFDFAMYVMILLVALDAYLFSWDHPFKWIRYRDNLLPKLVFWPALLGSIFVVTVFTFYKVEGGGRTITNLSIVEDLN